MLKCNVWILIFALLLASHMRVVAADWPSAEPESVGMASDRLARIYPVIQRFMEVEKLPCAITVIARRGKVIYCDKIGFQDLEKKIPVQNDTIFRMYRNGYLSRWRCTTPVSTFPPKSTRESGRYTAIVKAVN